jgi:hypothetical protein
MASSPYGIHPYPQMGRKQRAASGVPDLIAGQHRNNFGRGQEIPDSDYNGCGPPPTVKRTVKISSRLISSVYAANAKYRGTV